MHSILIKWLDELEVETEIFASLDVNEEAITKMVSFGINEYLLEEWGKDSVADFLSGCYDLYARKCNDQSMVFYAWFDCQTGQIRISVVGQRHGSLPFKCVINPVALSDMVNGIYALNAEFSSDRPLDVWQKYI